MLKKNWVSGLLICLAATMWGFDGVVLTPRLYNLNVTYVVFMLHLIPFFMMNFVFFREYKVLKNFSRNDYFSIVGASFFGGALGTYSIVHALFLVNFNHLAIVVLLQKLQPVFAIILAVFFLKEKLTKSFVLWGFTALVSGYFLTFEFHIPVIHGDNMVVASFWAILAAFSFGSATVFGKKALQKYEFKSITFFRYMFTTIIMFFWVVGTDKLLYFRKTTAVNWLFFIIIAFATGSGAIFIYYKGLKKVRASTATLCELCFPVSAVVFDYFINKHLLSLVQWISAIVMLTAILNITLIQRKEEEV